MLSSERNKLVDRLNIAFANIGRKNGTTLPQTQNNREPGAYDLFVAQHLVALANKRKDAAEKAAVQDGVIPDKEKDPRPEGTKEITFTGEHVQVMLSVSTAASRVDITKVMTYLLSRGVSASLVKEAVDLATTKNRPAHVFSTVLLTNG
jgi:hypothetical protein